MPQTIRNLLRRNLREGENPAVAAPLDGLHGHVFFISRPCRLREIIIDAARRAVRVEVHGDDGYAVFGAIEEFFPHCVRDGKFRYGIVDRGMMGDDQFRAEQGGAFDRRTGQIEGKDGAFYLFARIQ